MNPEIPKWARRYPMVVWLCERDEIYLKTCQKIGHVPHLRKRLIKEAKRCWYHQYIYYMEEKMYWTAAKLAAWVAWETPFADMRENWLKLVKEALIAGGVWQEHYENAIKEAEKEKFGEINRILRKEIACIVLSQYREAKK